MFLKKLSAIENINKINEKIVTEHTDEDLNDYLNENLKDELINTLLKIAGQRDDSKYENWTRENLELISVSQLDLMLGNYYMYDIERQK
jgi:hypothetical protein